jgi:hypothetical protein
VVPANVAASRVGEDFGVPFELIGYELLLNRSRVDANVESCKCRSEILYDAKLAPETGTRAGHNSQDKSLPLYRVYCIEAGEPGSVVAAANHRFSASQAGEETRVLCGGGKGNWMTYTRSW